mgnify:CR=1 FL=1
MKNKNCEHCHIQYDKINDYNYCEDCMFVFTDSDVVLFLEEEKDNTLVDEVELNLETLNNL